jgi:translation initiation factor IF-3
MIYFVVIFANNGGIPVVEIFDGQHFSYEDVEAKAKQRKTQFKLVVVTANGFV